MKNSTYTLQNPDRAGTLLDLKAAVECYQSKELFTIRVSPT